MRRPRPPRVPRSKGRWLVVALTSVGFVALGAWWTIRPVRPLVSSAIAVELVPKNLVPYETFADSPPTGTTWEAYCIPLPYDRVLKEMRANPHWRDRKLPPGSDFTAASFASAEAGSPIRIDVAPGQISVGDLTTPPPPNDHPENYSVVLVAVPDRAPFAKAVTHWVDRMLGRQPPDVPSGATVSYTRIEAFSNLGSRP